MYRFWEEQSIRDLGLMLALGYTCILILFYNENPDVHKKEKIPRELFGELLAVSLKEPPQEITALHFS